MWFFSYRQPMELTLLSCAAYRACNSEVIKSTLVADKPKERPRARLSWYHPDDTSEWQLPFLQPSFSVYNALSDLYKLETDQGDFVSVVPRDWFRGGLLADLMYYRPFMSK